MVFNCKKPSKIDQILEYLEKRSTSTFKVDKVDHENVEDVYESGFEDGYNRALHNVLTEIDKLLDKYHEIQEFVNEVKCDEYDCRIQAVNSVKDIVIEKLDSDEY